MNSIVGSLLNKSGFDISKLFKDLNLPSTNTLGQMGGINQFLSDTFNSGAETMTSQFASLIGKSFEGLSDQSESLIKNMKDFTKSLGNPTEAAEKLLGMNPAELDPVISKTIAESGPEQLAQLMQALSKVSESLVGKLSEKQSNVTQKTNEQTGKPQTPDQFMKEIITSLKTLVSSLKGLSECMNEKNADDVVSQFKGNQQGLSNACQNMMLGNPKEASRLNDLQNGLSSPENKELMKESLKEAAQQVLAMVEQLFGKNELGKSLLEAVQNLLKSDMQSNTHQDLPLQESIQNEAPEKQYAPIQELLTALSTNASADSVNITPQIEPEYDVIKL